MSSPHNSRPRIEVEPFNPMHDPDSRAVVFSFLGAGQGAFIKTVSKACKAAYECVISSREIVVWGEYVWDDEAIECIHKTTLLSAALASPARMRLAVEWGLRLREQANISIEEFLVDWQRAMGRLADYDTLLAAEAEIADLEHDNYTLIGAAGSGDVQKMIRLHTEVGCEVGNTGAEALNWAARAGSAEALRWLRQQGCQYDNFVHFAAACSGHLNVLQFLHEDGHTTAHLTDSHLPAPCEEAALRGHLEVLRWLREHGWPWGDDIYQLAAYGGSVPVLMYMVEQGLVFSEQAMVQAVKGNQLAACQYLRGIGCPWDARACTAAVDRNSNGTLRWLHENGCPWDTEAINLTAAALQNGSIEMLEHVWAEGAVPDAAVLTKMLCKACARDDFAAAQWLRGHGAQWPAAITAGMCGTFITALRKCTLRYTTNNCKLCEHVRTANICLSGVSAATLQMSAATSQCYGQPHRS
jgi:hypothetical protein